MKIQESIVLKNYDGTYLQKEIIILNNKYLKMLISIFDEGRGWTEAVKRQLLDPQSRGIFGEGSSIDISGNKVIIEPQFVDNPEDYAITIDRIVLLDLINQWQQLMEKKAPEIIFIRQDDGTITVSENTEMK